MNDNERLIETLYRGLAARDAATMNACYDAERVRFSDPVFTDLRGREVLAMWTMLTERAIDFSVTFDGIDADEGKGRARWEATYTFSKTKRRIHNRIEASFKFDQGKIVEHVDVFDLWAWAGMALGPVGKLLGWTPLVKGSIRKQARAQLDAFMASKSPG